MTLYRVSQGDNSSPWELLAKSPEHAIATIHKFYPKTVNKELIAQEITFDGQPITLLNRLSHGDKFSPVVEMQSGRYIPTVMTFVKGDFDPTTNKYYCQNTKGGYTRFDPYQKIITK